MVDLVLLPHTAARLTLSDAPALQRLCECCSDYYLLEEAAPARPDTAERLLTALPPGKTHADKHVIGIHAPGGELVGVLDLIRDFPGERDWWIGFLLLDPAARAAGSAAASSMKSRAPPPPREGRRSISGSWSTTLPPSASGGVTGSPSCGGSRTLRHRAI